MVLRIGPESGRRTKDQGVKVGIRLTVQDVFLSWSLFPRSLLIQ